MFGFVTFVFIVHLYYDVVFIQTNNLDFFTSATPHFTRYIRTKYPHFASAFYPL